MTGTGRLRVAVSVRSVRGRFKSHERHRALRLLREAARRQQHNLRSSADLLLVLTCDPENLPTFHEVTTAFLAACTTQHLLNKLV